ncbi:MAG: hypothetical protein C0592_01110 [Marinilabiliales bacterium]|nr:MAG: hypothetical protein C0592_01110 [Marinilabiliales bacterium]
MRIVRITNIVALLAIVFLWILLYFTQESYMGTGLDYPNHKDSTVVHFSNKNPYSFTYRGKIFGFKNEIKSGIDTVITGIWQLDPDSNQVHYFSFPDRGFEKLEALNMNPDSQLVIVGSTDSIFSVITFDSTFQSQMQIDAPAPFLGMGFPKGRTELVFGRDGKILGHIFTVSDTVTMRTYDLPNFYNRICEIYQVFVEDDTWKFLTQTNFYRLNDVWIILDTSRKSNYLIWDERGVYPEYPGIINLHRNTARSIMDYSLSKIVPVFPQPDSILIFENRKQKLIKPVAHKERYLAQANVLSDSTLWNIVSFDTTGVSSGFLSTCAYMKPPECNIPWVFEDSAYHFLLPESNSKQIFFSDSEYPAGLIRISENKFLLISSELSYAILDENGISLKRRNFLSTLHSSITRMYPEKRKILEVELPEFGAVQYFILLYGLLPLWLISLIVFWLITVLKKKPKFSVRDNHFPFSIRLVPGSIIFVIFFAISIIKMLHDFSIL